MKSLWGRCGVLIAVSLLAVIASVAASCVHSRQVPLIVIFENGFDNDSVIATVNDDSMCNDRLRTNLSINVADERHAVVPVGPSRISLAAPEWGVALDTSISVTDSTFVLVVFARTDVGKRVFRVQVYDYNPTAGRD